MSGFVGFVNDDGKPADRALLRRLTDYLAFRGPDAQETWTEANVGFGHAMLRTTREAANEIQPCSLNGATWIVADARVDARDDLKAKLKSRVRANIDAFTDPELILQAYEVWGEDCVQHIIGDFSFAVWDLARQTLFCARDHFGIKPFYYASMNGCLVFSNALNCVRLHPGIPDSLNDRAIADFLMFERNMDVRTTCYSEIYRLPPAHSLRWRNGELSTKHYWRVPYGEDIRYAKARDYVDHYRELLNQAVADRLRTDHVGVLMTGGLDSTIVAAIAHKAGGHVHAFTGIYDRIMQDPERRFSTTMAEHLKIPIRFFIQDDYLPYDAKTLPSFSAPEPNHSPFDGTNIDQYRQIAEYSRVTLTGSGGDPTLLCGDYLPQLLRPGRWTELLGGLFWASFFRRRIPRAGFRKLLKTKGKSVDWSPPFPPWLHATLTKDLDLHQRWNEILHNNQLSLLRHPRTPAYLELTSPAWSWIFEKEDPAVSRVPVEHRHPYFDVRVASYLLNVPALPWCVEKNLQRAVGRGLLPETVRCRAKTPLVGDPLAIFFATSQVQWWIKNICPSPELLKFVDLTRVSRHPPDSIYDLWADHLPVSLNMWLLNGRSPML